MMPAPPCLGGYWECVPLEYMIGDAVAVIFLVLIAFGIGYGLAHWDGRY